MSSSLMDLIHQAGFTGQAANTMYAIVMAESGGNSTALDNNTSTGDLSYGLAQINMIGAMGPQRLAEYGLKSNDDLYDPLTNLKVAYALSNHGTDFTPWSTYKSGAYQQFMGQSGAVVTQSASDGSSSDFGSAPTPTAADYQSALGDLSGLLTGVPSLKAILSEAVSGGWSTAKFEQAVEATPWYRQHNDATRQLVALQYSDPAEYKTRLANASQSVSTEAAQLGVGLDPKTLASLAQQSIVQGWSPQTLQHEIASHYNRNGSPAGQAAQIYQQLQQTYAEYGVPISNATLQFRTQQVLGGNTTADTYMQNARNTAKSMFPSIASQIDAGMTVKDIADPYIQQMSNTLELDPNSIGITDPLVKKALQGAVTTVNGKSSATTTPIWQFEQQLRSDPRWATTQNARDTVSSALVHIGNDFGFST